MNKPKKRKLAPVKSVSLRRDGLHVKARGRTAAEAAKKKAQPKHDPLENVSYAELQKLMDEHFACVSYDKTPDWRSMPETDPPDDETYNNLAPVTS